MVWKFSKITGMRLRVVDSVSADCADGPRIIGHALTNRLPFQVFAKLAGLLSRRKGTDQHAVCPARRLSDLEDRLIAGQHFSEVVLHVLPGERGLVFCRRNSDLNVNLGSRPRGDGSLR